MFQGKNKLSIKVEKAAIKMTKTFSTHLWSIGTLAAP